MTGECVVHPVPDPGAVAAHRRAGQLQRWGRQRKTSVEHFEGCLRLYVQDRLGISHDKGKTK